MSRDGEVSAFEDTCQAIDAALSGGLRADVVAAAARAQPFGRAVSLLRKNMDAHAWGGGGESLRLAPLVNDLDQRSRREGFHILHDWDGKADQVTPNTIVGDVVAFIGARRAQEATDPIALAILVDYYFCYLLALLSMRAWDAPDPGLQLDRITQLVQTLQGPRGSGHKFVDDAEMLMLLATSHYEPDERGYQLMLERVRGLPHKNRLEVAVGHAHAMGCHLRFAYFVTSGRSLESTRDDNVADYPWLCFAVATLMDEYERLAGQDDQAGERERILEALFNGLSPDPTAFLTEAPASLAALEPERARVAGALRSRRAEFLEAFKRLRPLDRAYSPLSLYFNFSQNLVKGAVVDALMLGEPWDVSLNGLFTGLPRDNPRNVAKERLARMLMAYARLNPDTIRGKRAPVVHYDPEAGRRSFASAMRAIEADAPP